MNLHIIRLVCAMLLSGSASLFAQSADNCFLKDFEPKSAAIPLFQAAEKTAASPTVTVTINASDTLGRVSKYMFGNAIAVWVGSSQVNPTLIGHLQKLSPTLIRYPGGSWSDIFFWRGDPGDLPASIPDGTNNGAMIALSPQYGTGSWPTTVDSYYSMRDQINATQGLITINYGYARYGLSTKPAEQAAHYAADWVRYDDGRTKFWEIGNENAGPWEAGWQIDTTMNKDGQPKIVAGELYGRHFKIFADSMRAAAAELDETIYIGGQILHYDGTTGWNIADRAWNEGFFREVGDAADFYVMHNYFGSTGVSKAKSQIDLAKNEINKNITFIKQDIAKKLAFSKPVALTEWNIVDHAQAKGSIANGMQAVVLTCEMIQNNFGLSARWLIATGEDGMFYAGNNQAIPAWTPRPDFFYLYYLQRFYGDHSIKSAAAGSGSTDLLSYASTFSGGGMAVVVVNKSDLEHVIKLAPQNFSAGDRYYIYSLKGGTDEQFSQKVTVNGTGPSGAAWGPIAGLEKIPANAYDIGDEIRFASPPLSVQYVLISGIVDGVEEKNAALPGQLGLEQNYPNPFNARTIISYSLPHDSAVRLRIYDIAGHDVATLLGGKKQTAGQHSVSFDAAKLPSGVYLYTLQTETAFEAKKMLLVK